MTASSKRQSEDDHAHQLTMIGKGLDAAGDNELAVEPPSGVLAVEDWRITLTREAMRDVRAGRVVDDDVVQEWAAAFEDH